MSPVRKQVFQGVTQLIILLVCVRSVSSQRNFAFIAPYRSIPDVAQLVCGKKRAYGHHQPACLMVAALVVGMFILGA
jgi:hypothetical protein